MSIKNYSLILLTTFVIITYSYFNIINPYAAVIIAGYGSLLVLYNQTGNNLFRGVLFCAVTLISLALLAHVIPGFHNKIIYNKIYLDKISQSYSQWINFDSIIVLLLFFTITNKGNIKFKHLIQIILAAIISLTLIAYLFNYIKFSPKLPSVFLNWAAINLISVCYQEVFFRGYLQNNCNNFFSIIFNYKYAKIISLIFTSLLFGIFHYKGGINYIYLSIVSGLFYGYAYFKTSRIEASIIVHFLINLTHIMLFTYPAYKG